MDKLAEFFRCIVLGAVQGLTEFLPVSSSFHLRLVPSLFNWPDVGLALSAFLHLGTLVAVLTFFSKDLIQITIEGYKGLFIPHFSILRFTDTLAFKICLGTIPAVVFGLFFHDFFEEIDTKFFVTATCLILVGLLLFFADNYGKNLLTIKDLTWQQSLFLGFAQAAALVPGVSRSGSTITVARLFNFTREEAARFSFLLGVPAVLGAGLLEFVKVLNHSSKLDVSWPACFAGFATSAIVGFLAIKFFLKFLQTYSFGVFVVYRIVVGLLVLISLFKFKG